MQTLRNSRCDLSVDEEHLASIYKRRSRENSNKVSVTVNKRRRRHDCELSLSPLKADLLNISFSSSPTYICMDSVVSPNKSQKGMPLQRMGCGRFEMRQNFCVSCQTMHYLMIIVYTSVHYPLLFFLYFLNHPL